MNNTQNPKPQMETYIDLEKFLKNYQFSTNISNINSKKLISTSTSTIPNNQSAASITSLCKNENQTSSECKNKIASKSNLHATLNSVLDTSEECENNNHHYSTKAVKNDIFNTLTKNPESEETINNFLVKREDVSRVNNEKQFNKILSPVNRTDNEFLPSTTSLSESEKMKLMAALGKLQEMENTGNLPLSGNFEMKSMPLPAKIPKTVGETLDQLQLTMIRNNSNDNNDNDNDVSPKRKIQRQTSKQSQTSSNKPFQNLTTLSHLTSALRKKSEALSSQYPRHPVDKPIPDFNNLSPTKKEYWLQHDAYYDIKRDKSGYEMIYRCGIVDKKTGRECTKRFKEKRYLTTHQKQHDPDRKFWYCEVPNCNAKLTTKRNFDTHMAKVHDDKKQFACEIADCDKSYKYLDELKRHMREHAGLLWECPQCGQKFNHKGNLKKHLSSGIKKCDIEQYNRSILTQLVDKDQIFLMNNKDFQLNARIEAMKLMDRKNKSEDIPNAVKIIKKDFETFLEGKRSSDNKTDKGISVGAKNLISSDSQEIQEILAKSPIKLNGSGSKNISSPNKNSGFPNVTVASSIQPLPDLQNQKFLAGLRQIQSERKMALPKYGNNVSGPNKSNFNQMSAIANFSNLLSVISGGTNNKILPIRPNVGDTHFNQLQTLNSTSFKSRTINKQKSMPKITSTNSIPNKREPLRIIESSSNSTTKSTNNEEDKSCIIIDVKESKPKNTNVINDEFYCHNNDPKHLNFKSTESNFAAQIQHQLDYFDNSHEFDDEENIFSRELTDKEYSKMVDDY